MSTTTRLGFTAIELLFSLAIILVLVSMTTVGLARALQSSAVTNGAVQIIDAASEARLLALRHRGAVGGETYGVIIVDDPDDGAPYVAVIYGGPGDGKASDRDRILLGPDGEAVHKTTVDRSAVLWSGDRTLRETDSREIAWFYHAATGTPLALIEGAFTVAPISVGLQEIVLDRIWGRSEQEYNGPVTVISPGTATVPGLSVRSGSGVHKVAIAVYPSGAITKSGF